MSAKRCAFPNSGVFTRWALAPGPPFGVLLPGTHKRKTCALTCQICGIFHEYVGLLKIALTRSIFGSKCFARTRWGSLQLYPDPIAGSGMARMGGRGPLIDSRYASAS